MSHHLHIDPFSGLAGDMFIGALLDVGAPMQALEDAIGSLQLDPPVHLSAKRVVRHSITATDFQVHIASDIADQRHNDSHDHGPYHHHDHDHEHEHSHSHSHTNSHGHGHHHAHTHSHSHHHHHVRPTEILAMLEALDLTPATAQRCRAVITKLGQAEAAVHGIAFEKVHFHEVGAVDSIVDMLGSAVLIDALGITSVSCGPIPVSRGLTGCAHGTMPVPAPATARLLCGLAVEGVDRVGELVTPTGAALVQGYLTMPGPMPAMTIDKIGYGAGDKQFGDVPNLLRVMLGSLTKPTKLTPTSSQVAGV